MSEFAVMIATPSKQYFFDAIDSFQVSANNQITRHPLPNGEEIADHMIVDPCNVTISGDFSMNASSRVTSLATLQKEIEDIKDNGVLCTVARCKLDGKEFRFMKRTNMCLTGVTWVEGINSMSFTFNFQQVMIYNVVERRKTNDIQNLPDITAPTTLNCVGSLISDTELLQLILQALIDSGIVEQEFWLSLGQYSLGTAVAVGGAVLASVGISGIAAAGGVSAVLGGIAAGGAATAWTGVGLIVAAIAGIALIGVGIYGAATGSQRLTEASESKSQLRQLKNVTYKTFKKQSDAEKQRDEVTRFNKMMDAIYSQVSALNSYIRCYTFEENTSQETMINVGSDYLVFTFRRNNVNDDYSLRISDLDNVNQFSGMMTAADTENLSNDNALCSINDHSIHVVGDMSDLTKCTLIVSSIDIAKFNDALIDLIESAISDNPQSESEGE